MCYSEAERKEEAKKRLEQSQQVLFVEKGTKGDKHRPYICLYELVEPYLHFEDIFCERFDASHLEHRYLDSNISPQSCDDNHLVNTCVFVCEGVSVKGYSVLSCSI